MTPERAEKALALLEMRARGNVARRAWNPVNCCTRYGLNCRLTVSIGHGFNPMVDYLHHSTWITRERALKVLQR